MRTLRKSVYPSSVLRILALLLALTPKAARASEPEDPPNPKSARISIQPVHEPASAKGLSLGLAPVPLKVGQPSGDIRPRVLLVGQFKREGWSLIVGPEKIDPTPGGAFAVAIPVESQTTPILATLIDLHGKQENVEYVIEFPDWERFGATDRKREGHDNVFSAGLGITASSHVEDMISPVQQVGASLRLSYRRLLLAPYLDFRLIGVGTAPLVADNGMAFGWVGLNALAGIVFPWPREPVRIGLLVGYYYGSMIVPNNAFGFARAMGPDLYPTFQYTFRNGNQIQAYAKFSPIFGDLSLLPWNSNQEIAGGGSFAWKRQDGSSWKVSLDYSLFKLFLTEIHVLSQSFTVGVSYEWVFRP